MAEPRINYEPGDIPARLSRFLSSPASEGFIVLENGSCVMRFDRMANQLVGRDDYIPLDDPALEWGWGPFGERDCITVIHPVLKKARRLEILKRERDLSRLLS